MIYTCTLNPSLDYFMEFDKPLTIGRGLINRSEMEYYEAGGKGVNCSIVLNNLGVPSRALGFLGGFTKEFYISLLAKYNLLEPRFTTIEGHTRINVKVTGQQCLEINAQGPYITDSDFNRFINKTNRLMDGDTFIFSGSCHDYLHASLRDLFTQLHKEGVRLAIDSNAVVSQMAKDVGAFLVLFNHNEAMDLFKCGHDEAVILEKACQWKGDTIENVIITFDKNRSALICDEGIYMANSVDLPENRINGVGFDDSILAGFMMNALRSPDILESFRFANSCGQATLFSKGLATREHVNSIFEKIELLKL